MNRSWFGQGQMFCHFKSACISSHEPGTWHQENSSPEHEESIRRTDYLKMEQGLDVLFEINLHKELPKVIKIKGTVSGQISDCEREFWVQKLTKGSGVQNIRHWWEQYIISPKRLEILSMKLFSHPNHTTQGILWLKPQPHSINHCLHGKTTLSECLALAKMAVADLQDANIITLEYKSAFCMWIFWWH